MADAVAVRKLKDDINAKNLLRSELERYVRSVSEWKDKLADSKSFQEQTKYTASIKRYVSEIEKLRARLNRKSETVDKHIREIGKYADSEVKEFCSQLEREVRDLETSNENETKNKTVSKRKGIAKTKGNVRLHEKIEKTRKRVGEDIEEIERTTGKIIKLSRHLTKVSKSSRQTASPGNQDELFYTQELKRIAREKAIFG